MDRVGQYGVEGYYDDILKGKTGVTEEGTGLDSVLSDDNQTYLMVLIYI